MELCKPLLNEFIRVLGVDATAASTSTSVTPTVEDVIPCNILTWKEIYRMVLFSTVCRDISISDVDINTSLKGKAFIFALNYQILFIMISDYHSYS